MADTRSGHQCYHCKQWVEKDEAHDCWTTTESALTADLSEDLRDAWERLRESAVEFGEQRIYASHHSIMFARKACYFFVRPKKTYLEVCIFLDRPIRDPRVRRVERPSRTKVANVVRLTHRDEVEAPFTNWLQDAYALQDPAKPRPALKARAPKKKPGKTPKKKTPTKKR